jgi:cell division protein FtsX
MVNFIKQYWKLLLALAYAIFIPLYFHQSTKSVQNALDNSRESSQKQINILQNSIDEQAQYYDALLQDYQDKMDAEEIRYNQEIKNIKEVQEKQQKELAKKFKNNPSTISDELKKRYNLNDK